MCILQEDANIQPTRFEEIKCRKNYTTEQIKHIQTKKNPSVQTHTGYPKHLLEFKNEATSNNKRYHPTQKPVALLEYLIKTYTNEHDVVLDNCMGSGSTGVACFNTGRKFIGIEKEEDYFNTAVKRIEEAKNASSFLLETKRKDEAN